MNILFSAGVEAFEKLAQFGPHLLELSPVHRGQLFQFTFAGGGETDEDFSAILM